MCLRHPKISKISRGHAPRPPLATLVATLSAAAYGSKSSTPKLKILSTALLEERDWTACAHVIVILSYQRGDPSVA